MYKGHRVILFLSLIFLVVLGSSALMAQRLDMTKAEYYSVLCDKLGMNNALLEKPSAFADRKYALLDVGKVRTEILNTNRLGYSREMITWEYPKGSGITYQWCQAFLVGGKIDGQKRFSCAARGCYEDINENHFEPYAGYDSGVGDNGIAMSNRPESWATAWPADSGPIGADGFPGVRENGDVAGDAEAFWVAGDDLPDCQQANPLHVKTYGRALQWSSPLADDFIVFKYYITNVGTQTIEDCYVGLHTDLDAPEQGSGEWMDDYAKYIDIADDPILGNMLYLWDGDDKSEGYLSKGVAWQGLKFLETPRDAEGNELGLTTLFVATYDDFFWTTQEEAYNALSSGITPIHNVDPHPNDWFNIPNTYGPDVTSMHASGPFDLAPGETVTFTCANIFGANEAELLANTTLCQLLYDQDYNTAQPPPAPIVTAVPGDQQVTLYWDAEPSESGIDPLTGNNAFEGYKIYRSLDRGMTWGDEIVNAMGTTVGYVPIAQYDLKNDIKGISDSDPLFFQGDDTGLKHKYVDRNLKNGVQYWYAVCAYDHEDVLGELVIPPLENARSIGFTNTVTVIPQGRQAGWSSSLVSDVEHTAGISAGTVTVEVLHPEEVVAGTYQVGFDQDPDLGTVVEVTLNGTSVLGPLPVIAPDDPNLDQFPVFNGMRLSAVDAETGIDEDATGAVVGDALWLGYWDFEYAAGSGMADDYEVRFTEGGSIGWQYSSPYGPVQVPFELWNITTDMQINCDVYDRGDVSFDIPNSDYIMPTNTPYDGTAWVSSYPDDYNYYFRFSTDSEYNVGDIFRVVTFKSFTPNDVYQFTATGATVSTDESVLDDITVVPNPYVVTSSYEFHETEWVKELQFHNLPAECDIRIFTLSGELVTILHHRAGEEGYRGPNIHAWNLWSYNDQEVAFGVYLYHVEAPGIGEKLGKFAVIK